MRAWVWPAVALALALGACKLDEGLAGRVAGADRLSGPGPSEIGPAAVPLEQGKVHFQNRNFGLAERAFRQAVEQDPNNTEAWLNLAASYDQLRRFDLARRAYDVAIRQVGYTAEVHNNLGYHYYLQGNLSEARRQFLAAAKLEPDNPYVANNLRLVDAYPAATAATSRGGAK